MQTTLAFPDRLRMIEERSTAFRAAVASASSTGVQVPTCPEWTLLDLVQHLGTSHRRWAATVAAGPADAPPAETEWASSPPAAAERDALLAWSEESTAMLLSALRKAGPDEECWTWWGGSQSPPTCGAVARHQLQHITVHAYDAQVVVGATEVLPGEAALDGVDEFLSTSVAGTDAWPHQPSAIEYHATDGGSWRISLSHEGTAATRLSEHGTEATVSAAEDPAGPDAALRGTASDLLLAFYARVPLDSLELTGDRRVFDQLLAWDPDA